ncbi:MAG: Uncharacterised protein [Gammaproteobacteria bacterium]|nr:MAG: Uncharacterised protein [Gammaproteobacteria bacterium]
MCHELCEFISLRLTICFLVTTLEITNNTFKWMVLRDLTATIRHVTEINRFRVRAIQYFVSMVLGKILPLSINAESVMSRDAL